MLEKFVVGTLVAMIVAGTPKLYKLGKRKKAEAVVQGKVYYGLLGCRIMGLILAGLMTAEMFVLMLQNVIEVTTGIIIMVIATVPISMMYINLYRKRFTEKYLKRKENTNQGRPLNAEDIESAVSKYFNKPVTISDIACTLVYVISESTSEPEEMHLAMSVGDNDFSSLDLMLFDQSRKAYYLGGERLALDERWLPKDDIFNFDTSLFKTFEIENDLSV